MYHTREFFFIDIFVSLAVPSLQLSLTTSLFSNLDSKLKTNTQYLSIVQCRVLVMDCNPIYEYVLRVTELLSFVLYLFYLHLCVSCCP
jgi:hypothetical protein